MKILLALFAAGVPAVAGAQVATSPSPTMNMPNYSTFITAVDSYVPSSSNDTPTMERQKLKRAIALRAESDRLREADGGTLSPANLRAIQRKANAIMSGRR